VWSTGSSPASQPASQPGLALLGSRATGSAHPGSDWDVGALGPDRGGCELDVAGLTAQLSMEVGSDDVDVVDLRRDAAVDGRLLFERRPATAGRRPAVGPGR